MEMVGDVKCYHCGHISGQVEGTKETSRSKLVITAFNPRADYEGPKVREGDSIRCERCEGPVFVEDLRRKPIDILSAVRPTAAKRARRVKGKAA